MRLFSLILALLIFAANPALAQSETSSAEDVLIAFFKTGNTQPNYEKLATSSKDYRLTPIARQKTFIAKEKQRLMAAYRNYNPLTDLISIRTRAFVTLHTAVHEDKTVTHSMTISFGKDDSLFFPFTYGDYNIAIVPQKMDSSFEQNLADNQYELFKNELGKDQTGPVALFIQLRPTKAYLDEPLTMGGLDQWALVSDVAGIIMTDSKGGRLWTYSAPWYVSPMTRELRDMYATQADEKEQEMKRENPIMPAQ